MDLINIVNFIFILKQDEEYRLQKVNAIIAPLDKLNDIQYLKRFSQPTNIQLDDKDIIEEQCSLLINSIKMN